VDCGAESLVMAAAKEAAATVAAMVAVVKEGAKVAVA
jgi:hypothetical protein